jgi:pyruvate kinase
MISHKKTKIVATLGPVSESKETLEKLILAGLDVARLNFSHGSHEEQGGRIKLVRQLEKKLGKHIAVVADIQGPKIRIGIVPDTGIELKNGQEITIDASTKEYKNGNIPLPSAMFSEGTKAGHIVHMDDGTMQVKILSKHGDLFKAKVIKGGQLFSKKGINVPELDIKSSILNDKDRADIKFAVSAGADYIALSFLRTAEDVIEARKFMGKTTTKIIAKIERPEALVNLEAIADASDAVMVARGDLGIETDIWELPIRQKEIIELVRSKNKPVIVATQMLDSMIRNPIPTRAEVSDVANAVFDGADAVMLSGESAQGKYPVEAVEMMKKVLVATEKTLDYEAFYEETGDDIHMTVANSTTIIASELNAKAILTGAVSGNSTRLLSSFRTKTPIVAIAGDEGVARSLALVWGVIPMVITKKVKTGKDLIAPAVANLKKEGFLKAGEKVVCRYSEKLGQADSGSAITIETI